MGTISFRFSAICIFCLAGIALLTQLFISAKIARADSATFDLAGPHVEVTVTRAGKIDRKSVV